jgi:RimJ/RimL family protein N-acetyltransferase
MLDHGYHRVQLEIYAFDEAALQVAEQAGFAHETARCCAYWRRGIWVDEILFGLIAKDLAES